MKANLFHKRLRDAATTAIVILTSVLFVRHARAFSLLGPYANWMTITNGFKWEINEIGGPMNIGEGYRWNVPVVTYAFDQSFVASFGTNGIAAVESAIAILNNLPPASQLDPSNFPLDTTLVNQPAAAQSLIDLKSTTLFLLLQQLGLAQPSRYSSTLHDFSVTSGVITGNVWQLNFDPFSLASTNAVNGTKYSYYFYFNSTNHGFVNWMVFPLDPLSPDFTAVADQGGAGLLNSGSFLVGLTRDDVGGLRYLLRPDNYAFETLLPDVHGTGTNSGNYVNLALRGGVDKITLVRQDYDELLGEAYVPLTNDFIDVYLTNGAVARQQLERVISRPDFIFSAFDPSNNLPYACSGTTNWLNNATLNESADSEGPGIIRPQVRISFQKYGVSDSVETTDNSPSASFAAIRWASFDGSTNAPIIFPDPSVSDQINDLQMNLSLLDTNANPITPQILTWKLSVIYGEGATLQTSTNLFDWESRMTLTNYGLPVEWSHICTAPQGYFRVVPQTNAP